MRGGFENPVAYFDPSHFSWYEGGEYVSFRIMKNRLDIAPVHHRLPDRIRAHTFICFLALVIQRAMRHRLHLSPLGVPPEELLYRVGSIQRHSVRLATGKNLNGLSATTPEQRSMFDAAGVPLATTIRLETAM